jgi:hypothetical protein
MRHRRVTSSVEDDVFRLQHFPNDGTAHWLAPKDLALAAATLRTFPESRRTAVEIGVWKGAWSVGILKNVPESSVLGVDPYAWPSGHEIRSILESRIASAGVTGRFRLVRSLSDASHELGLDRPAIVHVDGDHTETGARADLEWAGQVVAADGLVIVDDYSHPWFPGVASAMYGFLGSAEFRIVLMTEKKAYLSRTAAHPDWSAALQDMLANQSRVPWSAPFREPWKSPQAPEVLGSPVLLALGKAEVISSRRHATSRILRSLVRSLLPPVLHRALGRSVKSLRLSR